MLTGEAAEWSCMHQQLHASIAVAVRPLVDCVDCTLVLLHSWLDCCELLFEELLLCARELDNFVICIILCNSALYGEQSISQWETRAAKSGPTLQNS